MTQQPNEYVWRDRASCRHGRAINFASCYHCVMGMSWNRRPPCPFASDQNPAGGVCSHFHPNDEAIQRDCKGHGEQSRNAMQLHGQVALMDLAFGDTDDVAGQ